MNSLRKIRDSKIDLNKLRLTIINGIDCDFVLFEKSHLGVLGKGGKKDTEKLGDEIRITKC